MPCHESADRTEHSGVKLNNTGTFHGDQTALCVCCRPASDGALHGEAVPSQPDWLFWEIQLCFEMDSQCLWMKKKKKGFGLSAIHWNGNVSHFHEYWIESATACKLSLSSSTDIAQISSFTTFFFFFFFTQSPINVFAQSECAQTLTSVCQKWCQCSHGNYSYTLPPCSSTVRVALSAICLSNVRSHLSAGRCRCRGWRVAYGPQRRMWWWGEREGAELFGLICRFVLSS